MTVTVTLQFATAVEAAAFLGERTKALPPAAASEAADRLFGQHSPPAAAPTPVATPAPAPVPTPAAAPAALDFDKDVVAALLAYSKTVTRETFAALLKEFGVARVPELKAKPDLWAKVIAAVKQ